MQRELQFFQRSRNHAVGRMTRAGRGQRAWFAGDWTNIHQAEMMPPRCRSLIGLEVL